VVVTGRGTRVSLWCGAVGLGAGMSALFAAAVAQLHGLVPGGISGRTGGREMFIFLHPPTHPDDHEEMHTVRSAYKMFLALYLYVTFMHTVFVHRYIVYSGKSIMHFIWIL